MKYIKVILIVLTVLVIIAGSGLALYKYMDTPKTNEEVLDYLKDIDGYSSDVTMEYKNSRQTSKDKCKQFYLKNYGYRVEINGERVLLFNKEKLIVNNLKTGHSFETSKEFDEIYRYTFFKDFINLLYTEQEIRTSIVKEGTKEYIKLSLIMLRNNNNINSGDLFIDNDSLVPYKLVIYNNKGEITLTAKYDNFVINKEVDKNLFIVGR
ncbi:germination lipoprotein GerS-related protein [Clostridium cellulovorans]|uniref:Membrane associated protein n=1 Tax=Clostridium cellulovorans (strain ATCC 35296 / DSM 3052 / OCM 3 / 743B) TaxID=573061 RepID=D9SUW4_CLOC7|nr:germination lipoprotein GerS-related protein [Clostridium cellulovorans]ADL51019.1 hypothetical protein Clocel_1264 [Clostridium cellulovorans 743B]